MRVEGFEPFGELEGEELAEKVADADAGVKIAVASRIVFFCFIISINRTIKGKFHETRKGQNALRGHFAANNFNKRFH